MSEQRIAVEVHEHRWITDYGEPPLYCDFCGIPANEPAAPDTEPCMMDDAGQPCGRHLERGECSIHGRAAWPNPDACCLRNAFEEDAHSRTCDRWAAQAGPPPLDVEQLEEAWGEHMERDHPNWHMEGCYPICATKILGRLSRGEPER